MTQTLKVYSIFQIVGFSVGILVLLVFAAFLSLFLMREPNK